MVGMSVDGLASGLSTSALIGQLLQVEAIPQTQLKSKVKVQESAVSALQSVNAKFLSLLTAAKEVSKEASWDGRKASVSSTKASATAEPGAAQAQVSFSVAALARTHSVVSAEFADVAELGPELTLTGTGGSLTVGTGDLDAAVRTINDSDLGLSAVAVQVSAGRYRLQVTSTQSGAASQFTMGGASTVVQAGADAEIYLGGTATGVRVSSATNTFADLVSGTDVTVNDLTTGTEQVTVTVAADKDAISGKVKSLVDAANGALSEIAKQSASSSLGAAVLAGDSTVRQLATRVLDTVGSALSGSLAAYGVQLDRTGRFSYDSATFATAYAADPRGTEAAFRSGARVTPAAGVGDAVRVTGWGSATLTGSRDIVLTQAATQARGTIGAADGSDSVAAGASLTLALGSTNVTVEVTDPTETLSALATRLGEAARSAGIAATVAYDSASQQLLVTADGYGAAAAVTLTGSTHFTAASGTAGRDVAGSVGGVAATGKGRTLTSADGVVLAVDLDAAALSAMSGGLVGSLGFSPSFAERLESIADSATRAGTGSLTTAVLSRSSVIEDMNDRIEGWDRRLELRRTSLTRQFTAMEVALSRLQSQSSWLAGQIAGLPGYSRGD